jgi:hypothetical protein
MSSHRSRRVFAAFVGVALLATACGSTVQQTAGGVAGGAAGTGVPGSSNGLGAAGAPSDAALGTTGGVAGAGAGTSGGAVGAGGTTGAIAAGTSGGVGTGTTGGTSATGGGSVAMGPGVTATTISIGFPYTTNAQAAGDALGVVAGGGDQRAQWNLIINDLNKHAGGILGRRIVPVFHATDATSSDTYDAQEQNACSDYHEDHKVFAVIGSASDVLRACTEKAHAVNVYEDLNDASAPTFAEFPHYVEAGNLRLDRQARNWPAQLAAQGYFAKWDTTRGAPGVAPVKIGVLSFAEPASRYALTKGLLPALAAAGYRDVDTQEIASPKSTQDSGSTISAIQAAVLKFRQDGVTHFLPLDIGAGLALYFGLNADNQKYYPRYGLTTSDGVQTLIEAASFPKSQLAGAVGYGWYPLIDLPFSKNPDNGPYSNASRRACLKLMADGGQSLGTSVEKRSAVFECDQLKFLKAALEAGGPSVTQASFLAGVARIGTSFLAGNTFTTSFGPQLHDGVTSARLFAYDGNCQCFGYTSGLRPLV